MGYEIQEGEQFVRVVDGCPCQAHSQRLALLVDEKILSGGHSLSSGAPPRRACNPRPLR